MIVHLLKAIELSMYIRRELEADRSASTIRLPQDKVPVSSSERHIATYLLMSAAAGIAYPQMHLK